MCLVMEYRMNEQNDMFWCRYKNKIYSGYSKLSEKKKTYIFDEILYLNPSSLVAKTFFLIRSSESLPVVYLGVSKN